MKNYLATFATVLLMGSLTAISTGKGEPPNREVFHSVGCRFVHGCPELLITKMAGGNKALGWFAINPQIRSTVLFESRTPISGFNGVGYAGIVPLKIKLVSKELANKSYGHYSNSREISGLIGQDFLRTHLLLVDWVDHLAACGNRRHSLSRYVHYKRSTIDGLVLNGFHIDRPADERFVPIFFEEPYYVLPCALSTKSDLKFTLATLNFLPPASQGKGNPISGPFSAWLLSDKNKVSLPKSYFTFNKKTSIFALSVRSFSGDMVLFDFRSGHLTFMRKGTKNK